MPLGLEKSGSSRIQTSRRLFRKKLQCATAFCKPQMQAGAFDYSYMPFRLCLCQTFFISTLLDEKFPIQQLPCEAENANVCVCCNVPLAGKRGSVQGNLSVVNPSFPGGVWTYVIFLYKQCRLVSAENKELKFMACLTVVVPCSSFDYSSCSTPSALHTAEDVTYQRINPLVMS